PASLAQRDDRELPGLGGDVPRLDHAARLIGELRGIAPFGCDGRDLGGPEQSGEEGDPQPVRRGCGRPGGRHRVEVPQPRLQAFSRGGEQQRDGEHLNSDLRPAFYSGAWPKATARRRWWCALDAAGRGPQKELRMRLPIAALLLVAGCIHGSPRPDDRMARTVAQQERWAQEAIAARPNRAQLDAIR